MEKNQECFLHRKNDSKIFKFNTVEYKEALKDGWVSDRAEAQRQVATEIVDKSLEEVGQNDTEEYELLEMTVKELRALCKKLDICCVSKAKQAELIEKINEKLGK